MSGRTSSEICSYCNHRPDSQDDDFCLGHLPGPVMNACCGHGNDARAYVQFDHGKHRNVQLRMKLRPRIEGEPAINKISELKVRL